MPGIGVAPFACVPLLLLAAALAGAQAPPQPGLKKLPRPVPVCSMRASVVSIRILDAAGKPISGATVRATRLRDGQSLGKAEEMGGGSGEFQFVESPALAWIAAGGDRIRLVASARGKSAKTTVRVGRGPFGCRLVKRSGPDALRLIEAAGPYTGSRGSRGARSRAASPRHSPLGVVKQ
jgi:hypothetical protein